MEIINYISGAAIPLVLTIIIVYGLIEKNKVFDTFLEGARRGSKNNTKNASYISRAVYFYRTT